MVFKVSHGIQGFSWYLRFLLVSIKWPNSSALLQFNKEYVSHIQLDSAGWTVTLSPSCLIHYTEGNKDSDAGSIFKKKNDFISEKQYNTFKMNYFQSLSRPRPFIFYRLLENKSNVIWSTCSTIHKIIQNPDPRTYLMRLAKS